jgi:hypothetical protein
MAKKARSNPSAGIWIAALFGTAAVGGIAYVLTRPSTAAAPATGGSLINYSASETPCQRAADFVKIATAEPSQGPVLYPSYSYWAQQCGSSAPAWPAGVATS